MRLLELRGLLVALGSPSSPVGLVGWCSLRSRVEAPDESTKLGLLRWVLMVMLGKAAGISFGH